MISATPLVYAASSVLVLILFYNRTRLGLYIRVVGVEKPEVAEALGISITCIRYVSSPPAACWRASPARIRRRLHHHVHQEHVVQLAASWRWRS